MADFREGDRVIIPRSLGRAQRAVVAADWAGTGPVLIVLEGKTKAIERPASALRHAERPSSGPSLTVARPPAKTKAKLRAIPKPARPVRSARYLRFVREHRCCACQRREGIDAHHWAPERGRRGLSQKVDDLCTVPLCRRCHDHYHAHGVLPELDRRTTRELFVEAQRGLFLEWILLLRAGAAERRADAAR